MKGKLVVCLIVLLAFASFFFLRVERVSATDITLPYTITVSGSYTITAANLSIEGVGLQINADDVYVDGQHYMQEQTDANDTIACVSRDNITIVNFNQNRTTVSTTQYVSGFEINSSTNIVIRDSVFRRNGDNYLHGTCEDCILDNVTVHDTFWHGIKIGGDPSTTHNVTLQDCNVYNTTHWSYTAQQSHNFTFLNCTSYYQEGTGSGDYGFIFDTNNYDFTVENCTSIEDVQAIKLVDAENATVLRFVAQDCTGSNIVLFDNVTHSTFSESNITSDGGGNAFTFANTDSFNVTIQQSIFNYSVFGVYIPYANNVTLKLNHFLNQSSRPILQSDAGDENFTVLHNCYQFNASANNFNGSNIFINETGYGLEMVKTGNGTISPLEGSHIVRGCNWTQTFTAAADPMFNFTSFVLNGANLGNSTPLIRAITDNSLMNVTFTEYVVALTGVEHIGASGYRIYSDGNFTTLLSLHSTVTFRHGATSISIEADSNFNGSNCNLWADDNSGAYVFTPENQTDLEISFVNAAYVRLNGSLLVNGETQTLTGGDVYRLTWNMVLTPFLPIMFIFGMIGLVSMFFGGLTFVAEMQKKHYYKAFIVSTIAIAIGISFVLAWLWT